MSDPFGKLTYFRVYSGTVNKGDEVYNSTKERKERLVASFSCTPTSAKTSTSPWPVTSWPSWFQGDHHR